MEDIKWECKPESLYKEVYHGVQLLWVPSGIAAFIWLCTHIGLGKRGARCLFVLPVLLSWLAIASPPRLALCRYGVLSTSIRTLTMLNVSVPLATSAIFTTACYKLITQRLCNEWWRETWLATAVLFVWVVVRDFKPVAFKTGVFNIVFNLFNKGTIYVYQDALVTAADGRSSAVERRTNDVMQAAYVANDA